MKWDVLDLGPAPTDTGERWNHDPRIGRVVRLARPAPSGRRFGSRALGLGLDAFRVALRARFVARRPLIAMNPWTTVAARLVGFRDVSTVGLYAKEDSRSWKLLRAAIGNRPVVTLSKHEAERWQTAGGRAAAVRYGSTFPELNETVEPQAVGAATPTGVTVFIGGSSDRDPNAIETLVREVRASHPAVRLVIATGDHEASDDGQVVRLSSVTPARFSELIADSDVVYLPLADNGRAAGHMVLVEALQRGKPIVATWVAGMDEYFDDVNVIRAESDALPQLVSVGMSFRGRATEVHQYWKAHHSKEAFGERILDALDRLRAGGPR